MLDSYNDKRYVLVFRQVTYDLGLIVRLVECTEGYIPDHLTPGELLSRIDYNQATGPGH